MLLSVDDSRAARRPTVSPITATPLPTPAAHAAPARLDALGHALRVLLTPLDASSIGAWREAVHGALLALFEADRLSLYCPVHPEGRPTSVVDDWTAPHFDAPTLASIHRDVLPRDVAEHAFQASGRPVAHQSELVTPEAWRDSFVYNEFVRPHRLFNATFFRVEFGGTEDARLWLVGGPGSCWEPDPRMQQLARTVLPALRAGLATWQQLGARRAALGQLLDTGDGSALLIDGRGGVSHQSAACARLLADETPADAAKVREAAGRLALGAHAAARGAVHGLPHAPATTTVRTARHRYALAATRTRALDDRAPLAVVTVQRVVPQALDDAALRERFGLTPRELEVARLVAEGLTNQELAERLGVSFFTARNHVERLLPKLGAGNRARVGALLRGEGEER